MMGNQDLLEVKETVDAQVPLAHPVPEVNPVSWASLVLKEMMVHLARTENEVGLEDLASRVLLERMVKLDPRVPQDPLGHLVTRETQDPLVHKDYKVYLVPVVLQEKMGSPVKQVQREILVHLEPQEARVMLVPPVNVDPLVWQGLQVLEVVLVPLAPKEERALLVLLGHLVLLVLLVYKGCLEKEVVLEVPVQRVTRVNPVAQGLMELPAKMVQEVLLVPLVPLAQLANLEIRVKVVLLDFQA